MAEIVTLLRRRHTWAQHRPGVPIGTHRNPGKPSISRAISTQLPSPRMESRSGVETHRKASRGRDGLAAEARSRLSSAPNSRSTRFSRRIVTGSLTLKCNAIPVREKQPRSDGSRPARRFSRPQPHTDAKMQVFRRQFSRRYRRFMDGVRWRDRHHWRERRHGRRSPRFVEFDRGTTSGDEKTGKRGCSRQVERLERPV